MNRNIRMSATVCALTLLLLGCGKGSSFAPSANTTAQPVVVAAPDTAMPRTPVATENSPPAALVDAIEEAQPNYTSPEDLKPHSLKIYLNEYGASINVSINAPHVSEDGSTAFVMVENDDEDRPYTLLIRQLDGGESISLPLKNELCDSWIQGECRTPETKKQVAIANKLLAKHKWVEFVAYLPHHPDLMRSDCSDQDLNRHFRIPGFEVVYTIVDSSKDVHLRIMREDGALIMDGDFPVHTQGESEECRRGTIPYINDMGFDPKRRAMYVLLNPCHMEGCPRGNRFLFFRLPPPLPNGKVPQPGPKG